MTLNNPLNGCQTLSLFLGNSLSLCSRKMEPWWRRRFNTKQGRLRNAERLSSDCSSTAVDVAAETLLSTGMRISEAISLNRDSINYETKEATVIGKGSKARPVFFSDEALRWTSGYLSRRKDNNSALFVTYGDEPKRLRRGDIPRFLKAVEKLAGVKSTLLLTCCGIPSAPIYATTEQISASSRNLPDIRTFRPPRAIIWE